MDRTPLFTTGWLDTTLHDFLSEIDSVAPSMKFALITALDSSPDVAVLIERHAALGEHGTVVGKGVLVPTRRLLTAARARRLFFGFDEVWFFPKETSRPKPDGVTIV